jgi:hypothetical protein
MFVLLSTSIADIQYDFLYYGPALRVDYTKHVRQKSQKFFHDFSRIQIRSFNVRALQRLAPFRFYFLISLY